MEMQTINIDDVGSVLECALQVAIFEDAIPDPVSSSFFVQQALVFQGFLGVYNRIKGLVFNLQKFGGIVCHCRGLGHHCRYRLTLVTNLGHRQRVIFNFGKRVGTDLNEWLGLMHDLRAGQSADHFGKSFSGRSVDADDLCMRIRRPDKSQIKHLAQLDVIGKLAPSAQQAILFLARK